TKLRAFGPSPLYSGERVGVRGDGANCVTRRTAPHPTLSPEYRGEGSNAQNSSTGNATIMANTHAESYGTDVTCGTRGFMAPPDRCRRCSSRLARRVVSRPGSAH